jgi:hypothetical protein
MTAGRGILHEEMPRPVDGYMEGFQLWVNLPAKLKMTTPHYQEVKAKEIPEFDLQPGVLLRVIVGEIDGHAGPVKGIAADPMYLDVSLAEEAVFSYPISVDHTVLLYLYRGSLVFEEPGSAGVAVKNAPALFLMADGDVVYTHSTESAARFLLISGKPQNEPIFRYGPFVMNTRQEIEQTLRELRNGTFIQR